MTPPGELPGRRSPGYLEMDRVPQEEDLEMGARGADQHNRDEQECCCRNQGPKGAGDRQVRGRKAERVVTKPQRRLDRLEDLRINGSDQLPPLESGSDDS